MAADLRDSSPNMTGARVNDQMIADGFAVAYDGCKR
jgi:hypothetical protein